jgi:hypothetical protein
MNAIHPHQDTKEWGNMVILIGHFIFILQECHINMISFNLQLK